jgi:hypothetical protein
MPCQDDAWGPCAPADGNYYECQRVNKWHWQCNPGTAPSPPPAPPGALSCGPVHSCTCCRSGSAGMSSSLVLHFWYGATAGLRCEPKVWGDTAGLRCEPKVWGDTAGLRCEPKVWGDTAMLAHHPLQHTVPATLS